MSRKSTFYGFIAAASATAVSGLVYLGAKSNLAAQIAVLEGAPDEIKNAVNAKNLSLLAFRVLGILTVILFARFMALKRRDERAISA